MRILVSSWFIRPGVSGGWTTVADLLQPAHPMAFIGASVPVGTTEVEGIRVTGFSMPARLISRWPALNRLKEFFQRRSLAAETRAAFEAHRADLVLCTDERAALGALEAGLPFALRFHSRPGLLPREDLRRVMEGALFATGAQPDFPGTVFLPHSIDLDRFTYSEPPAAIAALMTTSLVEAERPDIFVKGTARSGLSGTIAGAGPLEGELSRLCAATGGRVRLIPAVLRKDLPALLAGHQVGVACLQEGWHTTYQMKVSEYQAAGLFPVVQPWSELALAAPGLTRTFRDEDDLAGVLDGIRAGWDDTLEIRRMNREFAYSRYHISDARRRFEEILASISLPSPCGGPSPRTL